MRTGPVTGVHFPNPPPPLLQATAVTPPGRKPIFHLPSSGATRSNFKLQLAIFWRLTK